MTPPRHETRRDTAAAPDIPPETADVFRQVEAIVAEQLDRARRGDVEAACDLGRRADTLICAAKARGLAPDAPARDRLGRLYETLTLALAQRADEIAQRRARLRQGKTSLRAYRHV